jgi:hypothetical protein
MVFEEKEGSAFVLRENEWTNTALFSTCNLKSAKITGSMVTTHALNLFLKKGN